MDRSFGLAWLGLAWLAYTDLHGWTPTPTTKTDYTVNPQRMAYGWTSNNSVFATLGMDYGPICERVRKNGEPGFAWLSNMQVRFWID